MSSERESLTILIFAQPRFGMAGRIQKNTISCLHVEFNKRLYTVTYITFRISHN